MADETTFIEEDWKNKEDNTIKAIIFRQLQKCIDEGSKEMDGGGLKRRIINGQVVEIITQNQREIFTNSVKSLWTLLKPHIKNKNEFEKSVEEWDNQIKQLEKNYQELVKRDQFILFNGNDEEATPQQKTMKYNQTIQTHTEDYQLMKVKLYQKKLDTINQFLFDVGYFEDQLNID